MAYIFLDESGDLGLSTDKTSKFFLITFLCCKNKRPIESLVTKTYAELSKQYKMTGGILHSYRERPITRQRLLKRLATKDCSIMAVYFEKKKIRTNFGDEKAALYNFIANILLDRIITRGLVGDKLDDVVLIASRRETNKLLNENFESYIRSKIKKKHGLDIKVQIKTSFEEKSLQAADFVSWAIFRKLAHDDASYYTIIKPKIVEENPLFS